MRAILLTLVLWAVPVMAQQPATATFSTAPTDADGDPLTFSWSVAPAGPSIDSGQGTSSATITFLTAGSWNVCVDVSDGVWPAVQRCRSIVTQINSPPTVPDLEGPSVIPMLPEGTASVSGPAVLVQSTCTDDVGCTQLQFKLNMEPLGPVIMDQLTELYEYSMDSTIYPNGVAWLGAVGCDAAGNCQNAETVPVVIDNTP